MSPRRPPRTAHLTFATAARRARALAAALTLAACQAVPGQKSCALALAARVPMRLINRRLLLPARLNGHAITMLLDTGAGLGVLSAATVKAVGAPAFSLPGGAAAPRGRLFGIGGSSVANLVRVSYLQLGRAVAFGVPFAVVGTGALQPVDILGLNAFGTADFDIDLPGGGFGVYGVSPGCTRPVTALAGALYTVPLHGLAAGDPHVAIPVQIGGVALNAVLDTGAPVSALFASGAARLRLQAAQTDRQFSAAGIGTGVDRAFQHQSTPITIGDLTVRNATIAVLPETSLPGVDMLLGMDFFTRVHVWVSRSSHTVILQVPPARTPLP